MAKSTLKCVGCKAYFPAGDMIKLPIGNVHSIDCAMSHAKRKQEAAKERSDRKAANDTKAREKAGRANMRERKEALKSRGDHIRAAEKEFNRFIRIRDWGLPCISCGRNDDEVMPTDGWKVGGAWDCGHFQGKGRKPELRFTESNAYRQCKSCNAGSSKYAAKAHTVEQEYERRLRERIGDAEVDLLKGPHPPAKWTVDEIKEIQKKYRIKANNLAKEKGLI